MSINVFDRVVVNITVINKSVSLTISKNRCNNFDSIWTGLHHYSTKKSPLNLIKISA